MDPEYSRSVLVTGEGAFHHVDEIEDGVLDHNGQRERPLFMSVLDERIALRYATQSVVDPPRYKEDKDEENNHHVYQEEIKKTADLPSVAESLPSRPSCSICKRAFSEKILPKECQVCSKSVCLVCLRNKLEDKLACDLCFLWKKTVESDEQMIAPLRQADEALQGAEKQMGVILQEIERTKASTEAEVRLLQDHEKSLHDIFLSEESQTQQEKEKFKKIYEALCTLKAESEKIRTEQESYERALGWADREIIDCNGEIVGKEILLEKRSEDFSKLEIQFEELRRSELIKGRAARTVPYDDASFLVKREDDDLPGHRSLGNGLNESSGHYNASLPQFVRAEREIFEPNQRPEGGGYYCLGRRTSEK